MLSKACTYGLKAMIYLAAESEQEKLLGVRAIAQATQLPEAFTAKILQSLVQPSLLVSVRGPNGGYRLARPAEEIYLSEIVIALDGNQLFCGCLLGFPECSEQNPCAVHEKFSAIRDDLGQMLKSTTLAELGRNYQDGLGIVA